VVLLLVAGVLGAALPVPYVAQVPGPTFNTLGDIDGKQMLTIDKDVKTYPTSGRLDFTTVSVTRAESSLLLGDAVVAYFDDDTAVVPKSLVYPEEQSDQQATERSAAELSGSKDSSQVAALRAAGYTVTGIPTVASVVKGGAAEGKLRAGDLVRAVDGTKVSSSAQTVKAVASHTPGEKVSLAITRKGAARTVRLTTKPDAENPKLPRIGVTLGTTYRYPFTVTNNVGRQVGGPSAGTMFALAIYDKLTPGSLTGGRKIAGTGEMLEDGTVGPIGGVRQKMAGAAERGAEVFLVPAANCDEATDGTDFGMTLVKTSTLKNAISSLQALAKNQDAKVPLCR
jgi:PDZ domain-containing protein